MRHLARILSGYAACMLLVRALAVLRGAPAAGASLGWDLIIAIVSLALGYTIWWLNKPRAS